jgi:tRNA threonylcarbamoyladenosine biosynthesis protein TsaE
MIVQLATPADTRALGRAIATALQPGDLVLLTGPLGAGKTVLAQGIGAGLGVSGPVLSPTFVIARVHRGGRLPLVHVDAYRLGSVAEVDDLDLDADLADSALVVEWGGGLVEQLAEAHLAVHLDRPEHGELRTATLVPSGGSWPGRLAAALAGPSAAGGAPAAGAAEPDPAAARVSSA